MTLGETIKYYRTQLNLSQTELGDRKNRCIKTSSNEMGNKYRNTGY